MRHITDDDVTRFRGLTGTSEEEATSILRSVKFWRDGVLLTALTRAVTFARSARELLGEYPYVTTEDSSNIVEVRQAQAAVLEAEALIDECRDVIRSFEHRPDDPRQA